MTAIEKKNTKLILAGLPLANSYWWTTFSVTSLRICYAQTLLLISWAIQKKTKKN